MVAGEASGDLLAGLLLDGVRARWPQALTQGIGAAQMRARGFDAWWPSDKLAVSGYVEALRHYREILGIRNQLKARLLAKRPDLFIGVDAPDFNLDLEADLKAHGVKTMHFVCPSIWAWRPERVQKIRRSVDHVLCLFPFEPALLAQHGIGATYVGHPLAGVIPMEPDKRAAREQLGLPQEAQVLALLPGSRQSELRYLGPNFLGAAKLLLRQRPGARMLLPAAAGLQEQVHAMVRAADLQVQVQVLSGRSHTALAACDVALVASGTATLEAALFKRPMVIAYNMHWLSWRLMRHQQLQPWVGLPNILCQEFVVPEFIQEAATPQALSHALLQWLHADVQSPGKIPALQQRFAALHQELCRDTRRLAADAIEKILPS
ncbi:MAG: lipid-A-disaccharide synthase [Betaproteobacteria bacterium]